MAFGLGAISQPDPDEDDAIGGAFDTMVLRLFGLGLTSRAQEDMTGADEGFSFGFGFGAEEGLGITNDADDGATEGLGGHAGVEEGL